MIYAYNFGKCYQKRIGSNERAPNDLSSTKCKYDYGVIRYSKGDLWDWSCCRSCFRINCDSFRIILGTQN